MIKAALTCDYRYEFQRKFDSEYLWARRLGQRVHQDVLPQLLREYADKVLKRDLAAKDEAPDPAEVREVQRAMAKGLRHTKG